jgi:hypothetical protein
MSRTQRDFTQMHRRQRISFSVWNQPTLQRLSVLGHDCVMRARALKNFESTDVVGPSGMAMIAVLTDCCEITA